MGYKTISNMAHDGDLLQLQRLIACAAQEGAADPDKWVRDNIWDIVSSPTLVDPYAFAEGNRMERPGSWEDVVDDGKILAVVQPLVQAAFPAP